MIRPTVLCYRSTGSVNDGALMSDSHDAEYRSHLSTWQGFVRFATWGVVLVVATLVAMALLLL